MSDRYPIPAGVARSETMAANSRFIASAGHTPSVDDARAFIAAVRAEFPDASHHCVAYLVGHGASVTAGMSDDGEPSGTAGRPMLAVLRGSGLGDITVVVTRYFGGTLLGTGGLVRAYSDAVRAVLDVVPRTERIDMAQISVEVSYAAYAGVRRLLEEHHALIDAETFAEAVTLTARIPRDDLAAAAAALAEQSAGQAVVNVL